MLLSIGYFIDDRGRNPVKEFIEELTVKEKAKIFAYLHELQRQGHNLRRPMADYLRDGIYELRPSHHRIFYFFFLRECAVLLHAIRKQTDKIPESDLTVCLKRLKEVEVEGNIEEIDLEG